MLSHVTHGGASHSPAADLHQADPVISAVYYGEIGSLGGDLFHTLAALFHLSNWDKCLSRLSPRKIELKQAVCYMVQGIAPIHKAEINSVFTNIDTRPLNLISSKEPLNGARLFCNSQGRE